MNVTERITNISADRLGIWASALCVVHCIATPVLISLSAVIAHFMPAEERFHRGMAVGIAALGAIALIKAAHSCVDGRWIGLHFLWSVLWRPAAVAWV